MRGSAHWFIGAEAGLLAWAAVGGSLLSREALVPAVVGAVGAVLPNISNPQSTLGRLVPLPRVVKPHRGNAPRVGFRLGQWTIWHRGETHTVEAAALATVATAVAALVLGASPLLLAAVTLAALFSYLSHLAVDLLNPPGIMGSVILRRIFPRFWVRLKLTMAAGGFNEMLFLYIVITTAAVTVPAHSPAYPLAFLAAVGALSYVVPRRSVVTPITAGMPGGKKAS